MGDYPLVSDATLALAAATDALLALAEPSRLLESSIALPSFSIDSICLPGGSYSWRRSTPSAWLLASLLLVSGYTQGGPVIAKSYSTLLGNVVERDKGLPGVGYIPGCCS
jgi:hypothetical protein